MGVAAAGLLAADDVRRQVDVAVENLLDGVGHLRTRRGFGDEADGAVGNGLQHDLLVLLGRDDHHRNGRCFVSQIDQAVEAVHAGHVQVQQHQIEIVVFQGQRQRAVEVGSFKDFAVGEAVANDVMDGFTEQRMVVRNQDLVQGRSPLCCDYGGGMLVR